MTDENNKVVKNEPKKMVLVCTGYALPVFPDGSSPEFVSSSQPASTALSLHRWVLAWMDQARERARKEAFLDAIADLGDHSFVMTQETAETTDKTDEFLRRYLFDLVRQEHPHQRRQTDATREAARAEVYRQVIAWCDAPPLDDADTDATVAEAAARDALREARREAAQASYADGQKAARAEVLAEIEALLNQSRAAVAQGEEERGRLVAQLDGLARAIDDETRSAVTLHRLAAHLRGTP